MMMMMMMMMIIMMLIMMMMMLMRLMMMGLMMMIVIMMMLMTLIMMMMIIMMLMMLSLVTDDDTELGTQIVKNLVALIKVTLVKDWESLSSGQSEDARVSFSWVVRRVMRLANQELVSTPSTITKRVLVFNLIAAACLGAEPSR